MMLCTKSLSYLLTTSFHNPLMKPCYVMNNIRPLPCQEFARSTSNIPRFSSSSSSSSQQHDESNNEKDDGEDILHTVQGIQCREVHIQIQKIGYVTILEATADAQNYLVDMALATEMELSQNNIENQLQSADPYGAVLWPAASAVANHLMSYDPQQQRHNNDKNIDELTILELGAGTGLVSIAAALNGVSKVMATDYEKVPLQLLEYAARHLNNRSDLQEEDVDLPSKIETFEFDICDESSPLPFADIVVAADIMYEPKTGIAMAHRVVEALKNGSRVIVGCSPGRPGRPKFLEELRTYIPDAHFVEVDGTTCSGPRNSLICGETSSSVSDTPKMLKVALLDLYPSYL